MMLAWSFEAKTAEEVGRLVRVLGKHRYVSEVDHRIHWVLDAALRDIPLFQRHAEAFDQRRVQEPTLELASRDPSLWRSASADDVALALEAFWTPSEEAEARAARLLTIITELGLLPALHEPFACPPDDPPHPELILLNWTLLPVDDLDPERHAGALAAMEDSEDEAVPGEPIHQEGPILAAPELCLGAHNGVLTGDFLVWADGPYSYSDYVLRGASKAAKLVDPPVGYRDL